MSYEIYYAPPREGDNPPMPFFTLFEIEDNGDVNYVLIEPHEINYSAFLFDEDKYHQREVCIANKEFICEVDTFKEALGFIRMYSLIQ